MHLATESTRRQQLWEPDQVAGRGGGREQRAGLAGTAGPAQAVGGPNPAERLLDPLAQALADGIAGMVDRRVSRRVLTIAAALAEQRSIGVGGQRMCALAPPLTGGSRRAQRLRPAAAPQCPSAPSSSA